MPEFDVSRIDDVIVGNAMPEGSAGAYYGAYHLFDWFEYRGCAWCDCQSRTLFGLDMGMAVAKFSLEWQNAIASTESMTSVPMTGFKPELNYNIVNAGHEDYYWGQIPQGR